MFSNIRLWIDSFILSPVPALFVILFVAIAIINTQYLDIDFLIIYSPNEYAFHNSLIIMLDGLRETNLQKFFGYGFYNYGFGFWLLNLIATLPFMVGDYTKTTIYMPRIVTALTALGGLGCLYLTARQFLNTWIAALLILVVVSMPAFWVNIVFSPDWLMTACLLVALYYFVRNDSNPGRNYWLGVVWFGLAASLGKFQAFVFLPFLFFYIFHDEIVRRDFTRFQDHLKRAVISVTVAIGLFVMLNPFVLHPKGLKAFLRILDINLTTNAEPSLSIIYKVSNIVFDFYVNPLLFVGLAALIAYKCIEYFFQDQNRATQALAFYCAIYFAYLLLMVHKDWQGYYLNLLIPAVILAPPLLARLHSSRQVAALLFALLSQFAWYGHGYADIAALTYQTNTAIRVEQQRSSSDFIVQNLKGKVSAATTVLTLSNVAFPYHRLGLNSRNIFIAYNMLGYEMISADGVLKKFTDLDLREYKLSRFKIKDFIVLRKDDYYYQLWQSQQMSNLTGYVESVEIMQRLNADELGYRRLAENADVIIYQRVASAKPEKQ